MLVYAEHMGTGEGTGTGRKGVSETFGGSFLNVKKRPPPAVVRHALRYSLKDLASAVMSCDKERGAEAGTSSSPSSYRTASATEQDAVIDRAEAMIAEYGSMWVHTGEGVMDVGGGAQNVQCGAHW